MKRLLAVPVIALGVLWGGAATASAVDTSTRVSIGSPTAPFSENKQNEPAVAVDAASPSILAAGSNDEIDMEACNAGDDTTCPFTPGVGSSGIYFSFDGGHSWKQPTYTGISARNCRRVPGNSDPPCTPLTEGPIGTLPWYGEHGVVSDGDPAVAFGPKPTDHGGFSYADGARLYYGNLTSNVGGTRSEQTFNGFEAIYVSRTDDPVAAAANDKSAWCTGAQGCAPVLVSQQASTTFSDKDQIWADNASSSAFFGTVYLCYAKFIGQEKGNAAPAQLQVAVSRDGGDTWKTHPIGAAADNGQRNPVDGCTIRTDSSGTAYVFGIGTVSNLGKQPFELMSTSSNGGHCVEQAAACGRPGQPAGRHRPGPGPSGHRRDRRRAQRPCADAKRRHRQRRPDGRGRDRPDGDELRERSAGNPARVLHRVHRPRRDVVGAAGDRDRR